MQEAYELKVRADEQAKKDKHANLLKGLEEARIAQFKERESRIREDARHEREEFLKVIEKHRAADEKEKQDKIARKDFFRQNQEGVLK